MADYTESKDGIGAVSPEGAIEVDWGYCEPLITPEQLKTRHLFGIPLVSGQVDPITGRPEVMVPEVLKEFIIEAVSLAETELQLHIMPKQMTEKSPFDKPAYDAFGYLVLKNRPVSSIESFTVSPSDGSTVFTVPNAWIDVGLLRQGQINLIPLTIALKTGTSIPLSTAPGGATFLNVFQHRHWVPSFWETTYTVGFAHGRIPKILNQFIGVVAAMEVLSTLAATHAKSQSTSLSMDGMSQSISTPGPELYRTRMEELGQKRKWLIRKVQRAFNMGIITDNV